MIDISTFEALRATPPVSPLAMPSQDFGRTPDVAFPRPRLATVLARLLVFGGAAALTVAGFRQMLAVFDLERISSLQIVLLGLVTLTFAWICLAAMAATAGLLLHSHARPTGAAPRGRTALVMPLYNEDPAPSLAALQAMGEGIAALGLGRRFEIFVVSDTRDPDIWVRETAAIAEIRTALAGSMAVWYRRRVANAGRKAGNIRDFVETWGGRYDQMLVLDADSLMEPATVVEMAARMDASPRLGILQTVPALVGGTTLLARLQQFAGRLYGPAIARGVSAWQGLDGNYWGHNAMIRMVAFAGACGLPDLPGKKPLGGHILSHDFVEAALIRRAGWEVRMDVDLGGSYEGGPPSLLDLAARDRRWAQGNLQHLKVIGTRGLRWPNRVHFAIGIGSYLMSPAWLLMICTGLLLTAQALLMQPQYFPEAFQLFPTWPTFDAERMLRLFLIAMGLLLLPKAVGLLMALASNRTARAFGGRLRLVASFVAEIVISALYAPILMLMQVAQIWEILRGRDSGWSAQTREAGAQPWVVVFSRHAHHSLAGLVPVIGLAWLAPGQLLWLAPVLVGLVAAPVASRLSGSVTAGRVLRDLGLFATPEERNVPALLRRAETIRMDLSSEIRHLELQTLARSREALTRHIAGLAASQSTDRPEWLATVTARAKLEVVDDPEAAFGLLTSDERLALAGSPDLLALWSHRTSPPSAALALAGE